MPGTRLVAALLLLAVTAGRPVPGLAVVLDQKENALIASPAAAIRRWLRAQLPDGPMFGAAATFTRKPQ